MRPFFQVQTAMKTYQHRFRVRASLAEVAAFHRQSASMGAITPPPVYAQIRRAPVELGEGDEMAFTLWMGPFPLRWLARIEEVSAVGFSDRQIEGPFHTWNHRHGFVAVNERVTDVYDTVTVEFKTGRAARFVGMGMWLNLPILFAYRGWKTRRLLEKHA